MKPRLGWLALLVASLTWAQGARFAVHPLEAPELSREERATLEGFFEVAIARVPNVRLAGSGRIDEAMARPEVTGCETRDAGLQFLALHTESLYAVYARLRPDARGVELTVTARVVRSDGQVVRRASLNAPLLKDRDLTASATELLTVLVKTLELGKLKETLAVGAPLAGPVISELAPPLVSVARVEAPTGLSARRTVGFCALGVGVATLAVGGVVLGMAMAERGGLTPNGNGVVPRDQAVHAASALRNTQIATVLVPAGAAVAFVGGLLAWWPESRAVNVSVLAGPEGGGVTVGGRFP